MWRMRLGLRLLHHAQRHVVVLAALEALPKSADLPDHRRPVDAEVADQVLAIEQLGVPVRLEVRVVSPARLVDPILVAVDDVGIGMPVQLVHHGRQRMTRQHIVVIQQDDELA